LLDMRDRLRHRTRRLVALCGATVALLLALEGSGQAGLPGKDGRLAGVIVNSGFILPHCPGPERPPGDCGFQDTIESFHRDGSGRRRLARRTTRNDTDRLHDVAWSPNGRRIAFIRGARPGLMRADGSHRHLLRRSGFFYTVAWAPDGRHLFLGGSSSGNANDGIYRIRTDGSHLRRLTHGSDSDPAVSTTGALAFVRRAGDSSSVYVVRHPGARAVRLLHGADPDWSPNGKRLAFARENGIWLCSSSGAHRRHITNGHPAGDHDRGPAWSPSGAWIAFVRKPDLYLVRPDGSRLRRVPLTIEPDTSWDSPTWQPVR
jgi:Tol biopolymer transport system component